MAALVNLALLVILGVLQVYSGEYKEYKELQVEYEAQEVKCLDYNLQLLEGNERAYRIMKNNAESKERLIRIIYEIIEAANKCCGKESEERKCLEETMKPALMKFKNEHGFFIGVTRGILTQTLGVVSKRISYAENELDCCCKIEACVPKIEIPYVNFKGAIQECKNDYCSSPINKLMEKFRVYLPLMADAAVLEEEALKYSAILQKMKNDVPKDGKCKEEKEKDKGLYALRKALRYYNLYLNTFFKKQEILNALAEPIEDYVDAALISIVEYPYDKEYKECKECKEYKQYREY